MIFDVQERLPALGLSRETLAKRIDELKWFHCFDFGGGLVTPGCDPSAEKLAALGLPDLHGKSVLDIGAVDGYYSFACERLGARRVVASDHFVWTWPGNTSKQNVIFVRELLGSRIELLEVRVEELSPETVGGTYDVVLFAGVLYHAPDPLGYLRRARSVTKGVMVLETLVDMLDVDRPAAAFYEVLNNDGTNHWGPNRLAVEAMCRKVGFSKVEFKSMWHTDTIAQLDSAPARPPGRGRRGARHAGPVSGRMVFHVYP